MWNLRWCCGDYGTSALPRVRKRWDFLAFDLSSPIPLILPQNTQKAVHILRLPDTRGFKATAEFVNDYLVIFDLQKHWKILITTLTLNPHFLCKLKWASEQSEDFGFDSHERFIWILSIDYRKINERFFECWLTKSERGEREIECQEVSTFSHTRARTHGKKAEEFWDPRYLYPFHQ